MNRCGSLDLLIKSMYEWDRLVIFYFFLFFLSSFLLYSFSFFFVCSLISPIFFTKLKLLWIITLMPILFFLGTMRLVKGVFSHQNFIALIMRVVDDAKEELHLVLLYMLSLFHVFGCYGETQGFDFEGISKGCYIDFGNFFSFQISHFKRKRELK